MRKVIDLNEGWRFEGEAVTLPHSWNKEDGTSRGYRRGTFVYEKEFSVAEILGNAFSERGKRIYLEIPAAAMCATVELNGRVLCHHEGGYSLFRADLTEDLKADPSERNLLKITVSNAPHEKRYPYKADFTFYGGLYRGARLVIVPEAHFELMESGSLGIWVSSTVDLEKQCAHVTVETHQNTDQVEISIYDARIYKDAEGQESQDTDSELRQTSEAHTFTKPQESKLPDEQPILKKTVKSLDGIARAEFVLQNVRLWDGLEAPYLYTASARILGGEDIGDNEYTAGGNRISVPEEFSAGDEISTHFGCRECRIDPDRGFFLNGRPYQLRGVSRHQDRKGCGNVLTDEMHREDLSILLEMGANAVRLAHYQHAEKVYALCDALGILAWAEIPYISLHKPEAKENAASQYRELILQNRNHPSIFSWAMSNEITIEGVTDDLLENHRKLNEMAHSLDPSRLTAMANLFMLEPENPLVDLPDIMGYNLYYGWYIGEKEDNEAWFDEFRRVHPHKGIALTEYGADALPKLQSPVPEKGDFTEGYQALYHEYMLDLIEKRPYIWGSFVWNLFDFAAAEREDAGDFGVNHKGLVSFDRKIKKDAYYIYKAHWSREPFVHLCGKRYENRLEKTTEIKVYSNLPRVELYVDGKRFGAAEGQHVFRFQVPISGEHEIEARGISDIYETDGRETTTETAITVARDKEPGAQHPNPPGNLYSDHMVIRKVDQPDPSYFKSPENVRNWFEEKAPQADDMVFSLDSAYGEIQADPEGAAVLNEAMARITASLHGGVGANVKIPPMLEKMISRISLRKLLTQSGLTIAPEILEELDENLRKIKKIKEKKTMSLPENFLLGAATAAHQVEGNNIHSDYWAMEQMKYTSFAEPSGAGVDHYHRYEEDIRMLAGAGLNAYRFSIEWARIEPAEGEFDDAETEHYRKVLLCCRENGVTPVVTLHHFTSPKWVIEKGGWEAESTITYFERYCRYIAEKLGDLMEYAVTINEANMGLQLSMIAKRYMKKMLSFKKKRTDGKAQVGINLRQMLANMKNGKAENLTVFGVETPETFVSQRTPNGDLLVIRAHQAAKNALKEQCPHLKVGLSLSLHDIQAGPHGEKAAAAAWNEEFLHYAPYLIEDDFIGVQNYTRSVYGKRDVLDPPADAEQTQMDYEFYPEALEHVIRKVHESFPGEILVTENGIATENDERRVEFLRRALDGVRATLADGLPVKGYFCWSLLDNFEWQKGYSMTFGLIAVDRTTMERHPKESLGFLGSQRGK